MFSLPIIPPPHHEPLASLGWKDQMLWEADDYGEDQPIPHATSALVEAVFKLCPDCKDKADRLYKLHEVKPGSSYLVVGNSWEDMAYDLAHYKQ